MALGGMPPRDIAEHLEIDPEAVHYELRVARNRGTAFQSFRPGPRQREFRILRIAPDVMQSLVAAADVRDIPTARLAEKLLEQIATDDLVDAVLNDGGENG